MSDYGKQERRMDSYLRERGKMSTISDILTKANIIRVCLWGIGILYVVVDAATDGIDILKHIVATLGGEAYVALSTNGALLGGNSGSDHGGQDCSSVIGWIIGRFLGCV